MDAYTLLIIAHLVGTILGVGGATMIEITLNKALRDGEMSLDERQILTPTYTVTRVGLVMALLSGFGFLLMYKLYGQTFRLYDPVLWAKIFVIVVIAVNALLLQAHKVSLYWGSALSFVSWWLAALLGIFLSNGVKYSFVSIMMVYVLALVVGAYLLHKIRTRVTESQS
jgi:hypothetical protein